MAIYRLCSRDTQAIRVRHCHSAWHTACPSCPCSPHKICSYGYTAGCPLSTAAAPQSSTQHRHPISHRRGMAYAYNTPHSTVTGPSYTPTLMPACQLRCWPREGGTPSASPTAPQKNTLNRLPYPKKGKIKGKKPAGRLWRTAGWGALTAGAGAAGTVTGAGAPAPGSSGFAVERAAAPPPGTTDR